MGHLSSLGPPPTGHGQLSLRGAASAASFIAHTTSRPHNHDATVAAEAAARVLDHNGTVVALRSQIGGMVEQIAQLQKEVTSLRDQRLPRCEEQLFEHAEALHKVGTAVDLERKVERSENLSAEVRRQLSEERRLLDDERHARGLQHEQLVARMDGLTSAVEAIQRRVVQDQQAVVDHVHAILDEREARVKAELIDSAPLQQLLASQQHDILGKMEGVVDDMFKEISAGLEVQVDESQLEMKLQSAVQRVRADFDTQGVQAVAADVLQLRDTFEQLQLKMQGLGEQQQRLHDNQSEAAQAAKSALAINEAKLRALHCVNKLNSRDDTAEILREFDTDRSGTVSRQELQIGLQRMGEHLNALEVDELMALLDRDGDGTVDLAEFEHVQQEQMKEQLAQNQAHLQGQKEAMHAELAEMQKLVQENMQNSVRLHCFHCTKLHSDAFWCRTECQIGTAGS